MFNFSNAQSAAKRIVDAKEIRSLLRENVLTVCDFSRSQGRPKHSVLGDRRAQMDAELCAEILTLVVQRVTEEGGVLESSLDALLTVGGRREFARRFLLQMAQMRRGVVSDVPEEAFLKSLGSVVKIGKSARTAAQPKPLMRYIKTEGATLLDLTATWNVEKKRTAERQARQAQIADLFASVLPQMPEGVTLGEHAAQAVDRYHRQQMQR